MNQQDRDDLRALACAIETGHVADGLTDDGRVSTAALLRRAANVPVVSLARDMTANDVRLMRYRAAALQGLITRGAGPTEAPCRERAEIVTGAAEVYARAMLAAETEVGT